jgi:hypothetical protein
LERGVVLAVLGCVVVLALIGLGYFAVAKKRGFKLGASFLRLFSVSVEIPPGASGAPEATQALEQNKGPDAESRQLAG